MSRLSYKHRINTNKSAIITHWRHKCTHRGQTPWLLLLDLLVDISLPVEMLRCNWLNGARQRGRCLWVHERIGTRFSSTSNSKARVKNINNTGRRNTEERGPLTRHWLTARCLRPVALDRTIVYSFDVHPEDAVSQMKALHFVCL